MNIKQYNLKTKNAIIEIQSFDAKDKQVILNLLKAVNNTSKQIKDFFGEKNSRQMNIPESITESLFCIFVDPIRYVRFNKIINGNIIKADLFDLNEEKAIEIKARSSLQNSPSSFSPKKLESDVYFINLSNLKNNKIFIYKLDIKKLESKVMNFQKNETFLDQQLKGVRPRIAFNMNSEKEINNQGLLTIFKEIVIE